MKDLLATAAETISGAEARLRQLMEAALAKQQYTEVARLASLAEGLLNLMKVARNGDGSPLRVIESHASPDLASPSANTEIPVTLGAPRQSDRGYPRFERQGDRLVKLAWSKKDRREYEHRATADVIFRIAELFERDRAPGAPFMMDSLMPFKTRKGEDIPSYQAYLALAWFRLLGVIESRGKDGYAVVVENLRNRVAIAWKGLPDALRR